MAELNPKDDTPAEFSFFWRRWVAIAWLVVHSTLTAACVWKVNEPGVLKWLAIALICANCFMALLYYAGASAVDVGKILQGIAQIKGGGDGRGSD